MARYRGNFTVAANYEPLKAAPFDARALVESKADLIAAKTWEQKDGAIWIYSGMLVSVGSDVNAENNGLYILTDASKYMLEESWKKFADNANIADLQKQINDINNVKVESDIDIPTELDLPAIGQEGITYYILDSGRICRWSDDAQTYIDFGGSGDPSGDLQIQFIYGGNANGN